MSARYVHLAWIPSNTYRYDTDSRHSLRQPIKQQVTTDTPVALKKRGNVFRTIMFYRIGNYYGKDNKQKIIGHLHMVRHDLQCPEQSSQRSTQQIFTPIGQHDTGDRRRDISQSNKLPNVPRRDNNEKIGRKRIGYRPKGCQVPTDIQRQR